MKLVVSDCRFGVSPVNYPDPDPEWAELKFHEARSSGKSVANILLYDLK